MNKQHHESITLTIKGHQVTLSTHEGDNFSELYKAQDLMKAAGLTGKKAEKTLWHWRQGAPEIRGDVQVTIGSNAQRGTYLTKLDLLDLASYIDKGFHRAVLEAFELLIEGKLYAASDKAYGHAIPSELKDRIKAATATLNEAVIKWNSRPDKTHEWDDQFACQYFGKVACQVVTGGSIEALTRGTRYKSLPDYMIRSGHVAGADAYIATCRLLTSALNIGLSYPQCCQMVGYAPATTVRLATAKV
jgi:hypothetical protein